MLGKMYGPLLGCKVDIDDAQACVNVSGL